MSTDEDNIVLVAPFALGDDVVGGTDLVADIHLDERLERLSGSETVSKRLPIFLGDSNGGGVGEEGVHVEAGRDGAAGGVVPDDDGRCTRLGSEVSLLDERAVASDDEGNLSFNAIVLRWLTSEASDGDEVGGDAACGGSAGVLEGAEGVGGVGRAGDGEGVGDKLGGGVDNGLAVDVVAVGLGLWKDNDEN